ncbi:Calx-beta domain-containing protein [Phenylobacterium sp.]|jgi:serralysin|uniref:Calx-beta domain-containing protein n=1 Tax=Phenylobacterium sp. TaxID=1871053 RepID=UPI002F9248C0
MPAYMGAKWGSPTNGAPASVTWSFGTGAYAALTSQFGGYAAFDSPIAAAYRASVQAAFDAWEAIAGIDFVLVDDSAEVGIRVGNRYIDGSGAPGQSSTLAQAQYWSSGGSIARAQLYFDVDAYTVSSFYHIALHEVGHTIGIGHASDPNSLMYYAMTAQNTDGGLTSDDVLAARTLYGGAGASPSLPPPPPAPPPPAATISLAPLELSASEGGAGVVPLSFEIRRSGDASAGASVQWRVEGHGFAPTSASDFEGGALPAGAVTFAPGETVRQVSFGVRGDNLYENDETFVVRLTGAVGGQITGDVASGLIRNDDPKPTVALQTTRIEVEEGATGATLVRIQVTRSQPAEATSSVNYAITGDTDAPVNGADFLGGALPAGQVVFAPGETVQFVEFSLQGDVAAEADEGFRFALSSFDGTPLGMRELRGVVLNDDVHGPVFGTVAADRLRGGAADDRLQGFAGDDRLDGGAGVDTADYDGMAGSYSWWSTGSGEWIVQDLRTYTPEGRDTLVNIEQLAFADRVVKLVGLSAAEQVARAEENILRNSPAPGQTLGSGAEPYGSALSALLRAADATTSVATLSYQFFTGHTPTKGGLDYLVSPSGPNPNNINSAYYQSFSLENRYINFAVNLGKLGEGRAAFEAKYAALSLADATRTAYTTIFGSAPGEAKLEAILTPSFDLAGQHMTRAEYFAYYGQDGAAGLGTKAAMVGWLLAEAAKADVGVYARANEAFLLDLADGAPLGVDLIAAYGSPDYIL